MKLKRTYEWRTPAKEFDVASAVDRELDGRDQDRGSVEAANATADNAVAFLGRLTEMLHASAVLSDQDVVKLLGTGWEIAE